MLVSPFRTDRPAVLLVLLMLVPALWIRSFITVPDVVYSTSGPLYDWGAQAFGGTPLITSVFGVVLTIAVAILLNAAALRSGIFSVRDNITALLFPLLFALRPHELTLSPMLCAAPMVIWAFQKTWMVQGRPNVLGDLFDAGFLLGIAALFRTDLSMLVVAIWIGVAIMRPFAWREYLIPLIGTLLPLYFCWSAAWLMDIHINVAPFNSSTLWRLPATVEGLEVYYRYSVLALLIIFGIAGTITSARRMVMKARKARNAFLAMLVVCAVISLIPREAHSLVDLELMALPLAVLFSYALRWTKPLWLAEALLTLLIAGAFWSQWA